MHNNFKSDDNKNKIQFINKKTNEMIFNYDYNKIIPLELEPYKHLKNKSKYSTETIYLRQNKL